jgi:hypothetical protein
VKRLADRLAKCPAVSRFNDGQHKEAWELANTFADIEGEYREFLDEQLPELIQSGLRGTDGTFSDILA